MPSSGSPSSCARLPPVKKSTAVAADAAGDLALMLNSSESSTQNTPAQDTLQGGGGGSRGGQGVSTCGAGRRGMPRAHLCSGDSCNASPSKLRADLRVALPCMADAGAPCCPPECKDEGAHAGHQEGLEGEPVGEAERAQRGCAPQAAPHQQRAAAEGVDQEEGEEDAQHLTGSVQRGKGGSGQPAVRGEHTLQGGAGR